MDARTSKRQKVEVACQPCRIRKAKCDGEQPICGPCRVRQSRPFPECTWSDTSRRLQSEQEVQWLRARLRFLERGGERSSPEAHVEEYAEDRQSPRDTATQPLTLSSHNERAASAANETLATAVSPVFPVIGPTDRTEDSAGFYGGSSAGNFMQSISMMVDRRLRDAYGSSLPLSQSSQGQHAVSRASGGYSSQEAYGDDSLPPRKTADRWMDIYWRCVFPLYPFLDPRQTQDDYQSLWSGERELHDQHTFLCLLNAIFALSLQLDSDVAAADRVRLAKRFYERARNLMNIFQTGSVTNVQAILMLGLYCQSSNDNNYCWILTGLAIRVAQGIGLHAPRASERAPDPASRELLRRVWYGCVLLDRTLAMTSGRPCMISSRAAAAVSLPSELAPLYESDIVNTATSPQSAHWSVTVKLDFFKFAIQLHEILNDVLYTLGSSDLLRPRTLKEIYNTYAGSLQTDSSRQSLLDLERQLQEWHDSIPLELRAKSKNSTDNAPWLCPRQRFEQDVRVHQTVVLQQMYLQVRLILLRPFLSYVISLDQDQRTTELSDSTPPLFHTVAVQCAVSCVHVAQAMIRLIHDQQDLSTELATTAPWWCNVLFLHAASTVHIAALLSPEIVDQLSESNILQILNLGLDMLQTYIEFGNSIDRLLMRLRVLLETVTKRNFESVQRREQIRSTAPRSTTNDTATNAPFSDALHAQTVAIPSSQTRTVLTDWPITPAMSTTNQPLDSFNAGEGFWDDIFNPFDFIWSTIELPDVEL